MLVASWFMGLTPTTSVTQPVFFPWPKVRYINNFTLVLAFF